MLRWLPTLGMRPHFEAIPRSPGVVCPRNAPSLQGYLALLEGCLPADCIRFEDIPQAPKVAYPRNGRSVCGYPASSEARVPLKCTFGLMQSRVLRGSCSRGMHFHFEAIPHTLRAAYPRNAFGWTLFRELRVSCILGMHPHFEAIPRASGVVYPRYARSI